MGRCEAWGLKNPINWYILTPRREWSKTTFISLMENPKDPSASQSPSPEPEPSVLDNTYLIIRGTKSVPLRQNVIKIGRQHDNSIVIDDPRISRHHVELRVINGHFTLFDLNSTGGTYVNGRRTDQAILYHGDRISLAGVELLFSQNAYLPNRGRRDTSALMQNAGERGTAFFRPSFLDKKRK